MRYLISIATYRRPDQLQRLLDSLAVSVDSTADVVVVDNDSEASAREVAQNHAVVKAYEVESEPGIASARNRGLGFFTDDYGGIIFVDDDEWVEPSWYQTLARYAESTAAGVVNGPVGDDPARSQQYAERKAPATPCIAASLPSPTSRHGWSKAEPNSRRSSTA